MKNACFLILILFLACSKDLSVPDEPEMITFLLSVSSSEGGAVDVSGGTYNQNTTVQITATPSEGYSFTGWTGNASGDSNPLTVMMNENKNITANFSRIQYSLGVVVVGQGSVAQEVISSAKSKTDYESGTTIRLTANPESSWLFYGWEGLSTGFTDAAKREEETLFNFDNPVDITLNNSINATATFQQIITEEEIPNGVVGKWKIRKPSTSSKSGKTILSECGLAEIIFRTNGTFTMVTSTSTDTGEFVIDSNTTISFTQSGTILGSLTNLILTDGYISFSVELNNGCTQDAKGDKDDTYEEVPGSSVSSSLPVISLIGSSTIDVQVGEIFTDPGATAYDDEDGDISSFIFITGGVNTSVVGTNTITYSVSDFDGNTISIKRTVNVRAASNSTALIYFENQTCKCPNAKAGDSSVINGITYTVVDDATIRDQLANNNFNLCTTLVTNMEGQFPENNFFRNNSFNYDIGFWDTSNVTTMFGMFLGSTEFDQDISFWNTSSVIRIGHMFDGATSFNQNIGNWDISNTISTRYMFANSNFNMDIGRWDTSKVNDMQGMFYNNKVFNKNIGNWNTSNVTVLEHMFLFAESFNQPIGNWDVSNVTNMRNVFGGATNFNQDLSNWCVTNFASEPEEFSGGSALTEENKPVWGTCPDD